ncbi:MAG: sugar ABC transporter permease [Epulopiscium sp.]|nr:sugar ABC transporter permease [Candidatus Epulonipiscium sp.]
MGGVKMIIAKPQKPSLIKRVKRDWQLLLILLPGLIFYIIFRYGPMYGMIISFKDYSVYKGIINSPWVGLKHFKRFFGNPDFFRLFRNTFMLGMTTLIFSFPFPIIFAVLLNEIRNIKFKKVVQTASYVPSFLSIVIISSMIIDFLSPGHGIINQIIAALGFEKIYFMIRPEWFRTVYVASEVWSGMGFNAILFIAAIAGIDPQLYEAAELDGCGRIKKMWYITVPSILPTIATLFILKSGSVFRIGFEKVLLLYNPATYEVADVFATYVYRQGLVDMNYSYAAAVGLFESVVALAMLLIANTLSKKLSEQSIW